MSGVTLATKTGSRPTYLQRIGRAISSGKDKKQDEVQEIIELGKIIGIFEDVIIIGFAGKAGTDINTSIETFLREIEIKGVRKDFKKY